MNKILLTLILGMFLISFVSAEIQTLGIFNQGQEINLIQTCGSCTFNNITSIYSPEGNNLISNMEMTKDGTIFNYTLNGYLTTSIGTYIVNGVGDLDGTNTIWNYSFEVKGGSLNFFILAFTLFFVLTFYGLRIKNEWVAVIGCFGLLILGIYTSFYGIDLYKNELTNVISYVTIAIGLGVGFEALMEITYY